jgi:hypothetical protein
MIYVNAHGCRKAASRRLSDTHSQEVVVIDTRDGGQVTLFLGPDDFMTLFNALANRVWAIEPLATTEAS